MTSFLGAATREPLPVPVRNGSSVALCTEALVAADDGAAFEVTHLSLAATSQASDSSRGVVLSPITDSDGLQPVSLVLVC